MRKFTARRQSKLGDNWIVEREIPCINGLSAWFEICVVHEADENAVGYTDGEIGSARERAVSIVNALNGEPRRTGA